jgi:hypothetical protein
VNVFSWLLGFILRGFGLGAKKPDTTVRDLAASNATVQTELDQEKVNDADIARQTVAQHAVDQGVDADVSRASARGVPVDPDAAGSAAVLTNDDGRRD